MDIAKVSRFEKWIKNPDIIERFFNQKEIIRPQDGKKIARPEHYAARFAAKEAFSKALGTGVVGFGLKDIYIENDQKGKPQMIVTGKALEVMDRICGTGAKVFVSLSHEKEYAVASVVIERG